MAQQSKLLVQDLEHRFMLEDVLANINFTVGNNEVVAIVGPSGCGKSTLLNIIAGLIEPINGCVINNFNYAMVFQQPRLLPWKTCVNNIAIGLQAKGINKKHRQQQASQMGLSLGLMKDDLNKYPSELSGGMQSRVALARALVLQPELLLLDEPFSALDFALKIELYQLLQQQLKLLGSCAIIITHDLMEAVRLADRILVMQANPGRIVEHIKTQDLFHIASNNELFDDLQIYQATAKLLQQPIIRQAFGLPVVDSRQDKG